MPDNFLSERAVDPNLSGETLALKSAIRTTRIEIGIQLKKIRNQRARIHGNWGSQFSTIFGAQGRLFGGPARDPRGGAEPSPAERPSKLQRVSEPARSEDLEDFNRISMQFPRIWSSVGSEPSSAEPQRSSAEPEASSADVKIIGIS